MIAFGWTQKALLFAPIIKALQRVSVYVAICYNWRNTTSEVTIMPKAASPIRLDESLMSEATLTASTLHRSAAEQVEYWADIGRKVSNVVDPEILLEVQSGLATLHVEKTSPVTVDPDALFEKLDHDRKTGALSQAIAAGGVRYQASSNSPGTLEAVYTDGRVETGVFVNGEFCVAEAQ